MPIIICINKIPRDFLILKKKLLYAIKVWIKLQSGTHAGTAYYINRYNTKGPNVLHSLSKH